MLDLELSVRPSTNTYRLANHSFSYNPRVTPGIFFFKKQKKSEVTRTVLSLRSGTP